MNKIEKIKYESTTLSIGNGEQSIKNQQYA